MGEQAGTGLNMMNILQSGGCLVDGDLIAADLSGERRPFGLAGENIDTGVRRYAGQLQNRIQPVPVPDRTSRAATGLSATLPATPE